MAATNGTGGTAAWSDYSAGNSDVTANVKSWTLDYTADTLDTTDFTTAGPRSFIAGLTTWGGSFETNLDATDVMPTPGTKTRLTLTAATSRTFVGLAVLTGLHPSVAVDGLNSLTVDFQGSSDLTIN